jgi:hypothetical protein
MALSAIEVYNKPDFKGRDQIFPILIINAWESLLKAKILKDNRNKITSLYIRDGKKYKRNRSGNYLTINLQEAISQCALPQIVVRNILRLTEIRDAATHLTASSASLPYLVFTLGTATLRNYSKLMREWFGIGLNDYNFYILPLGFAYPFHAITMLDLKKEPESIATIISSLSAEQKTGVVQEGDYYLLCEIRTNLVSAKKLVGEGEWTAKIDPTASDAAIIVRRDVNVIDQYPFTYSQVLKRVKAEVSVSSPADLNNIIRDFGIKDDPTYARYNFKSKLDEQRGATKLTPVVYNESFIRFAVEELRKKYGL